MSGNVATDLESGSSSMPPHAASPRDRPITAREAATVLGVNERTVRRAIGRGDLPATKRGRGFQIAPEALEHFRSRETRGGRRQGRQPVPLPANLTTLSAFRPSPERRLPRHPVLPAPLTGFIGREHEIAAISQRLLRDDVRLVTLTGAGGVGKTRLALRVAEMIAPNFADGAVFVSLAEVHPPSSVLPAIARAVGVREASDRSLADALHATLRGRALLLVLDNLEHLLDQSTVSDLANLLHACRGLVVLATSRASLNMTGEHRFVISPLAVPGVDEPVDRTRLADYGAIALFVARAQQVQPGFALTDENAPGVIDICRRLDGLPLALELAAAWLRTLSPPALLARLEQRLPVLVGGAVDHPARLRTMRDAITWSHDLLSRDEQVLFRRLAVFVGGFTLQAADAVSGVGRLPPQVEGGSGGAGCRKKGPATRHPSPVTRHPSPVTLDLVASLVDKSLLHPMTPGEPEPRFTLLETVREFALDCLTASDEEAATRGVHAAHYLALSEAAANDAGRVGSGDWMRRLTAERANLWAALDWFEQTGSTAAAMQMTGALWHYWYRLGEMAEGRTRLERALASAPLGADLVYRARARRGAGVLAWQSADYGVSRDRLEAALADYRALGDQAGAAWVLNSLGCLSATLSDQERAEDVLGQALAIFREIDDTVGIAQLTANLGELAEGADRHGLAIERLEEAVARWGALDDRVGAARAQVVLTHALLARGEATRAAAVLPEALATIRDHDYEQILPAALRAAAQLAAGRGEGTAAARWYGAAEAMRDTLGVTIPAAGRAGHERTLTTVRETLGRKAFAAAWATGRGLSATRAIAEVLATREPDVGDDSALATAALSSRERGVLRLLAAGQTDKEIADALFISRRTASKHVSAILDKLGVRSRTAAAALAHRDRLA